MKGAPAVLLLALLASSGTASAQNIRSRSGDYLFITTVDDTRAIWVNPAGLGVTLDASVMGEFVFENPDTANFRLAQWTVGFNSRFLAFGYQRDRLIIGEARDAYRFGTGLGFHRGALGAALTIYSGDGTDSGIDLGIRYHPLPSLELGGVLRQIGRPRVRGQELPFAVLAGAAWTPLRSILQVAGEAEFEDRPDTTGYEVRYRLGGRLATRGRLPLGVIAALDLGSSLGIDAVTIGVVIGGNDQVALLGTALKQGDSVRLDRLSATGVARRRPPRRQF